jgi:hypothetical protein
MLKRKWQLKLANHQDKKNQIKQAARSKSYQVEVLHLFSCSQGTETEELTLKQKRKENRETGDRQDERDTRTKSLK